MQPQCFISYLTANLHLRRIPAGLHKCWFSVIKKKYFRYLCVKICAVLMFLNNFCECWLFYLMPTCSWIWIKHASFPVQILATFARETSACPAQEKDLLRMSTNSSLSTWLMETFPKVLILKKLPTLSSCKYHFTSLKFPNSTEILNDFVRNVSMHLFLPAASQIKKVKKYFLIISTVSTFIIQSSLPNNRRQESLYNSYLWHSEAQTEFSKWQIIVKNSYSLISRKIITSSNQNLLTVNLLIL